MKYIFLAFLLFTVFACNQNQNNTSVSQKDSVTKTDTKIIVSTDEYLITDTSFGKINKMTAFNDLEKIFGKNNIQDTISYGAEGMDSSVVTKIFSNTAKEIIINWQIEKFHNAIADIDCFQDNSPYHTADSLKVGSTLEKLVQVNGKKINFYGTGWDYGGLITSYNGGKFQKSNIFFSLNSAEDASQNVLGDRELNTDLPKIKPDIKKLYISKISLSLHTEK